MLKEININIILFLVISGFVFTGCREKPTGGEDITSFEIEKKFGRGPFAVNIKVNKKELSVAETLRLRIETVSPQNYEVHYPQISDGLKNLEIIQTEKIPQYLNDDNKIVDGYEYRLEPYLGETCRIDSLIFDFTDSNDLSPSQYEIATEPIEIKIYTSTVDPNEEVQIAEIKDVVEMPSYKPWTVAGIVIVIIAAALVWIVYRKKQESQIPVVIYKSAHEIALDRLRALAQEDLAAAGKIKLFYHRISDILRHYIEDRFSVRAPERTTEEFLEELAVNSTFTSSEKKTLEEFLKHCDLVKFAKYQPDPQSIDRTYKLVEEFVEKTKSDEIQIDITNRQLESAKVQMER